MWHTDYKQLDDKRWLIIYEDGASRYVTGRGVFDEATTERAIEVLDQAIYERGKPKLILTDHGTRFYAVGSEKKKGVSKFEEHIETLGNQHILGRVVHPQTNGKAERVNGEVRRKIHLFLDVSGPPSSGCPINPPPIEKEPLIRFMRWYNHARPHMSLNVDIEETPDVAFKRKMPPDDLDESDK